LVFFCFADAVAERASHVEVDFRYDDEDEDEFTSNEDGSDSEPLPLPPPPPPGAVVGADRRVVSVARKPAHQRHAKILPANARAGFLMVIFICFGFGLLR